MSYKSIKYGRKVIQIGRFEPSSQICSNCGHRQKLKLSDRTYVCHKCGMTMDRDVNAAINIRDFAIHKSQLDNLNTDGTSGINACGVECPGSDDASCLNETIDNEARKSRYKS